MKRTIPCGVFLAVVSMLPGVGAAAGFDVLGTPLAHRVDLLRQPAAPPLQHFLVRAGIHEAFLGAGLRDHVVALQLASSHTAVALGAALQRSAVHRRVQLGLAGQWRLQHAALGVAAQLQQWSFLPGATRRRWQIRCAWSLQVRRTTSVHLQFVPPLADLDRPQAVLQLSSQYFAPFTLVFREERWAGLPVRRRWGVTWGSQVFTLRFGFDSATHSTGLGVSLAHAGWLWDSSASLHPLLGWSRFSGLAWSR